MAEDFDNHRRIFDRGNDLQSAKTKKVIEPMIESSCACTTIFENLRALRKLVADENSNLTTKRTKDMKFGKLF